MEVLLELQQTKTVAVKEHAMDQLHLVSVATATRQVNNTHELSQKRKSCCVCAGVQRCLGIFSGVRGERGERMQGKKKANASYFGFVQKR